MDMVKIRYLLRCFLLLVLSTLCLSFEAVLLYLAINNSGSMEIVSMCVSNIITVISLYAVFLKNITSMKDGKPESEMLGTPTNTPDASPIHYPNYQATAI
jgi:hypothetical protein